MPNWCGNKIKVSGPKVALDAFLAAAKGIVNEYGKDEETDLSLEKLLPTPPELLNGGDGWYTWRLRNWGTKWDISSCKAQIAESECEAVFDTDSAWNPPLAAFLEISLSFPLLEFEVQYDEPNMDEAGVEVTQNGEVTHWEKYSSPSRQEFEEDEEE
jgi:hypothetical protein